jgi:hypothetical protein
MPEQQRRFPAAVVVGRLVLLLAAGAAVIAGLMMAHRPDGAAPTGTGYACPMHPEVTAAEPGSCSICGMVLERRAGPPAVAALPATGEASLFLRSGTGTVQSRTFSTEVRAPAWVEPDGAVTALLYADELAGLATGAAGSFAASPAPGSPVAIRRAAAPPERWDQSTSRVRFELAGPAPALAPGASGWVTMPARTQDELVVPLDAVLEGPRGPYVLVASADGRSFARRRVEIGRVAFGQAVVVSGLAPGERVAGQSAFFLDAGLRLGAGP